MHLYIYIYCNGGCASAVCNDSVNFTVDHSLSPLFTPAVLFHAINTCFKSIALVFVIWLQYMQHRVVPSGIATWIGIVEQQYLQQSLVILLNLSWSCNSVTIPHSTSSNGDGKGLNICHGIIIVITESMHAYTIQIKIQALLSPTICNTGLMVNCPHTYGVWNKLAQLNCRQIFGRLFQKYCARGTSN